MRNIDQDVRNIWLLTVRTLLIQLYCATTLIQSWRANTLVQS